MSAGVAPREEEGPFRKWGTLAVLSLALAIILIDSTLLNVALSALIRDLKTTLQKLQWVISAYSLILAAMTVTGGRMGDLFGRKRMFITGAITFVVGAFIASISHSFPVLLLGESIVEGIGAALMMPATASLLVAKYRGHDRAMAFGIWGAVAAAASAIGPIVGGFLTTHYSWRWGFRINIFVVALLLAGSPLVDDDREPERKQIDWMGVLLSSAGLFLVVFGIIESESYGWIRARKPFPLWQPGSISIALVSLAAGVIITALFAIWEWRFEARGGTPVVSMHLFANRQFVAGAGVTGVMMLGQNGVIFTLPVFLQSVRQLDALHTGLTLLPMSLTILIVSPTAAKLTKRIPHKRLVQSGLIVNAIAIVILRFSIGIDMKLTWLIPGLALYGIGMGLVLSQINNLTLSAVDVKSAGEASGVTNTFRQVGISLGTAIIGAILISTILFRLEAAVQQNLPPQARPAITKLLIANSAELAFGAHGTFNSLQPQVRNQMTQLRREATTEGIHRAFLWCAFFAVLALVVSMFLPLRPGADQAAGAPRRARSSGSLRSAVTEPEARTVGGFSPVSLVSAKNPLDDHCVLARDAEKDSHVADAQPETGRGDPLQPADVALAAGCEVNDCREDSASNRTIQLLHVLFGPAAPLHVHRSRRRTTSSCGMSGSSSRPLTSTGSNGSSSRGAFSSVYAGVPWSVSSIACRSRIARVISSSGRRSTIS